MYYHCLLLQHLTTELGKQLLRRSSWCARPSWCRVKWLRFSVRCWAVRGSAVAACFVTFDSFASVLFLIKYLSFSSRSLRNFSILAVVFGYCALT